MWVSRQVWDGGRGEMGTYLPRFIPTEVWGLSGIVGCFVVRIRWWWWWGGRREKEGEGVVEVSGTQPSLGLRARSRLAA